MTPITIECQTGSASCTAAYRVASFPGRAFDPTNPNIWPNGKSLLALSLSETDAARPPNPTSRPSYPGTVEGYWGYRQPYQDVATVVESACDAARWRRPGLCHWRPRRCWFSSLCATAGGAGEPVPPPMVHQCSQAIIGTKPRRQPRRTCRKALPGHDAHILREWAPTHWARVQCIAGGCSCEVPAPPRPQCGVRHWNGRTRGEGAILNCHQDTCACCGVWSCV
jgi:hypothetical protein